MKGKRVLKKLIVFLVISCVLAGIAGGAYYLYSNQRTLTFEPAVIEESDSFQKKPYCGFYGLVRYRLSDLEPSDEQLVEEIKDIDKDATMVLMEIELSNYVSSDISERALLNFENAVAKWSANGYQIILRATYDFQGHPKAEEPTDIGLIKRHIHQIAPVVNNHKDTIYMVQGVFAGLWGEMHSSKYIEEESLFYELADTMNESIDPSVFLVVRTPQFWRMIAASDDPLTADKAYNGSLSSRLGLYNDGMLGSISDFGTYNEESSLTDLKDHKGQGNRSEEIAFQNQLCLFVPNGGEVINDNPYNDIENAVTDLEQMHVSYLNSGYDLSVMEKWKNSEYQGTNGYYYIADRLGYRYVIKAGNITEFSGLRHKSDISVTLENTGFAPTYKKFTPSVKFVNSETKEAKSYAFHEDSRTWYPNETVTISMTKDFSFFEEGTYDVYFCLNDIEGNYEIPCANDASYDCEYGGYYLGQICLE